jgi:hypothetical protein
MGRKRRDEPPTPAEPYWAPLPRQELGPARTLAIVAQHLVPLVGLWWLGGSVENFLLLCVFNIAFSIACLVAVGLSVSTRQTVGDQGVADALGALITLMVIAAVITVVLTALFGWVVVLIASESALGVWNAPLGWSVLAIMMAALPGMSRQYRADLAATLPEKTRQQRDQPIIGVQLMCAGLMIILSGQVAQWGHTGTILMAIAVTALFIFRDLRPDLMRQLTRPSARPRR